MPNKRQKSDSKEAKTAVLYVRMTEAMKADLVRVAAAQDITETQAARRALNFWLKVQPR